MTAAEAKKATEEVIARKRSSILNSIHAYIEESIRLGLFHVNLDSDYKNQEVIELLKKDGFKIASSEEVLTISWKETE